MAQLKPADVQYLVNLKVDDLTMDLLNSLLSDVEDGKTSNGKPKIIPSRFSCTDTFILPANAMKNKKPIPTTVGKFIFNKYILEGSGVLNSLGYQSDEMTNSNLGKLEGKMDALLKNGVIKRDEYVAYIDRRDKFSLQMHFALTSSCTLRVLVTPPAVIKRRNELLKEHEQDIKNGDIVEITKIENELTALAKKELAGDPGMNLYNSGARAKFGNSYKNMNIMKGPVYNAETGKYDVITSNLMEGLDRKSIPAMASAIVQGAFPKACGSVGYLHIFLNLKMFRSPFMATKGSDSLDKPL